MSMFCAQENAFVLCNVGGVP